jgi:AcrR family transcriptional regulator
VALESARTTASSTGRGDDQSRRQRADAVRNVVALVEAAKTVFGGSGVDAPAKEITDLAGVGVGTLYRHFPHRSDLIVAVLQHEIDQCIQAADELGTTLDPWDALIAWIGRFTDFVGTKRGLASALHSGDPAYEGLPQRLLDRLEPEHRGDFRVITAPALPSDVSQPPTVLTCAALGPKPCWYWSGVG